MKKNTATKEVTPAVAKAKKDISKKLTPAGNIHQALFAFQSENIVLPRNGQGTTSAGKKYKYVTLDDLINGTRPFFMKHGIAFTQLIKGNKMDTILIHAASGTTLTSDIDLGHPTGMQDYGGRITYTRRYSLQSMLGLSAEEDTDAAPGLAPAGLSASTLNNNYNVQSVNKPVDTVENNINVVDTVPHNINAGNPPATHSESFMKAKGAVDTCYNPEAFTLIKGQIERSSRLSDSEKVELQALLKARDTEVNGTVHID